MNISLNFVCTKNSRKSPARMNEMKRWPWSIPKSRTRLLRMSWNKTAFQIHIFARIPVNLSSLWRKKRSPVANPKGSRTPPSHFLCVNHNIRVNWNKNFTIFANKRQIVTFEKKKVLSPARCDRRFDGVFRVSRNIPLPEQHVRTLVLGEFWIFEPAWLYKCIQQCSMYTRIHR